MEAVDFFDEEDYTFYLRRPNRSKKHRGELAPIVHGALPYIEREPDRKQEERRISKLVKQARKRSFKYSPEQEVDDDDE